MQIINWGLVKQPLNWLTISIMLILAAMAGTLVLEGVGLAPSTSSNSSDTESAGSDSTSRNGGGPGLTAN
jgi:FlaG/FlaF family flagellin (archaellin)